MTSEIAILKKSIARTNKKVSVTYAEKGEVVRVHEIRDNVAIVIGRKGKFSVKIEDVEI